MRLYFVTKGYEYATILQGITETQLGLLYVRYIKKEDRKKMTLLRFFSMFFVSLFLLFIDAQNAASITCDMLTFTVDEARTELQRAANKTDFWGAKDYARRAKSALEDAAMAAMDWRCNMAFVEFDTAASRARYARDASNPREFVDSLNGAIRSFNMAIEAIRTCARTRG